MAVVPPDGFRHHMPVQVRWGDMDALSHVNNAAYLSYLEHARVSYFADLALWDGHPSGLGLIMARVVMDFKLPLHAGEDAHVFTRCSRLGNRSFDTEQALLRVNADGAQDRVAVATITIVVFDYTAGRSAPMPEVWREGIIAYELQKPQM